MTIAIQQVRLIDGTGAVQDHMTILVRGTKIVAVGPSSEVRIPKGSHPSQRPWSHRDPGTHRLPCPSLFRREKLMWSALWSLNNPPTPFSNRPDMLRQRLSQDLRPCVT
ncbi:MAG: hypothetical protein IPP12_17845 [Nitrospira sp.]|nr:hypothetical protein [Nitrospira sp.]